MTGMKWGSKPPNNSFFGMREKKDHKNMRGECMSVSVGFLGQMNLMKLLRSFEKITNK